MKNCIFLKSALMLNLTNMSYCATLDWDNIKKTFCIQPITDAHPNQQVNLALTFLLYGFWETGSCIKSTRMKQIQEILDKKCNHLPTVIQKIILLYCPSPDDAEKEFHSNEWYLFEKHIAIPIATAKGKFFKTSEVYKKHLKNTFVTNQTTFKDFISRCLLNLQRLADLGYASNPYQYHIDKNIIPGNCNYCEETFPITPIGPCVLLAMPKDHSPDFIEIIYEPSLEKITCKHCDKDGDYLYCKKFSKYPRLLMVTTDIWYNAGSKLYEYITSKKPLFKEPFKPLGLFLTHSSKEKLEYVNKLGISTVEYIPKKTDFIYQHYSEDHPCFIKNNNLDFNDCHSKYHVQASLYRYTGQ